MGDKIKIFPAEINGINQADEDCELKLTADIIELDPVITNPTGGSDFEDVDAYLRYLASLGTITPVQEWTRYPTGSEISTSSNNWINIFDTNDVGDDITVPPGQYILVVSHLYTQSIANAQAGTRVRINNTRVLDARDGVSVANVFEQRSMPGRSFVVNNNSRIRVDFGQTDDGGIMTLKDLEITLLRIGI